MFGTVAFTIGTNVFADYLLIKKKNENISESLADDIYVLLS